MQLIVRLLYRLSRLIVLSSDRLGFVHTTRDGIPVRSTIAAVDIETISRDDLKAKLDAGEDIRLVMALHEWAFRAIHIPGSIHFKTPEEAHEALDVDDEIIVYCSDPACVASQFAYQDLVAHGYHNVRRYEGGLSDWQAAGLPLEGERAD